MTAGPASQGMAEVQPEVIVGVDFGAPLSPEQQQRKVLVIAAERCGPRQYVARDDCTFNKRLFLRPPDFPGWKIEHLFKRLADTTVSVVGFDFPFGLPTRLMNDPSFARAARFEAGAFATWENLGGHLATSLSHEEVLDFATFEAWKDADRRKELWERRATDGVWKAQPPLKNLYQVLFNMTLAGIALLWRLRQKGYAIAPFDESTPGVTPLAIEVYPGGFLKELGLRKYKTKPKESWDACKKELAAHDIRFDVSDELVARCCEYDSLRTAKGKTNDKRADHDAMDALVALAITILFREGCCEGLPESPGHERVEGFIYGRRRSPTRS